MSTGGKIIGEDSEEDAPAEKKLTKKEQQKKKAALAKKGGEDSDSALSELEGDSDLEGDSTDSEYDMERPPKQPKEEETSRADPKVGKGKNTFEVVKPDEGNNVKPLN